MFKIGLLILMAHVIDTIADLGRREYRVGPSSCSELCITKKRCLQRSKCTRYCRTTCRKGPGRTILQQDSDSHNVLFVAGGYNVDELKSKDFMSKVEILKLEDGGDGSDCPEPGNFPGRIYGAMGTNIGEVMR